jgi:hypothetical protein
MTAVHSVHHTIIPRLDAEVNFIISSRFQALGECGSSLNASIQRSGPTPSYG